MYTLYSDYSTQDEPTCSVLSIVKANEHLLGVPIDIRSMPRLLSVRNTPTASAVDLLVTEKSPFQKYMVPDYTLLYAQYDTASLGLGVVGIAVVLFDIETQRNHGIPNTNVRKICPLVLYESTHRSYAGV